MEPNILFITCDQLRWDALGCYGNRVIRTPHIDALASTAFRFTDMHVAAPVCAPNRASLATGRWPSVHGLRVNGCVLPATELTLMECLRQAGYSTYGVGKMHFRPQWSYAPGDRAGVAAGSATGRGAVSAQPFPWEFPFYGFERGHFSEDNREGPFADYLRSHGLDPWADPHSYTYPQHVTQRSTWPEEHHQTTWVADRSLEYLEQQDTSKPCFLWASFIHPHHPFNPPSPYDEMYNPQEMPLPIWSADEAAGWPSALTKKFLATSGGHEAIGMCNLSDAEFQRVKAFYYGMISLIDKQVGRLVDALKTRGQWENTIVVFTSDHGELLGDHRLLFKGTHHECVTKVPFLLRLPGGAGAQTRGALCQSTDVMPTLLDCAGVPIPASVQGKSLLPALEAPLTEIHTSALIETGTEIRTLRTKEARLTWHAATSEGELYDIRSDPNEFRNQWGADSSVSLKTGLIERLVTRMAHNIDPLPVRAAIG